MSIAPPPPRHFLWPRPLGWAGAPVGFALHGHSFLVSKRSGAEPQPADPESGRPWPESASSPFFLQGG